MAVVGSVFVFSLIVYWNAMKSAFILVFHVFVSLVKYFSVYMIGTRFYQHLLTD